MRRTTRPHISLLLMIFLALATLLAACGRKTPTPTPPARPTPAVTRPPTPLPYQTPPAGLPPATSLLPDGAWLTLHVESPQGARWTMVAYGDRDEIFDEVQNQRWVDKGVFISRQRALWEALLRQARFEALSRDTYLTACDTCPMIALAVRGEAGAPKGVWLRLRPYDATAEVLPLLPIIHTLRLSVESLMTMYEPEDIVSARSVPALGPVPEDPLGTFYGDKLQMTEGKVRVGQSVRPWARPLATGAFTRPDAIETVMLIGGDAEEEQTPLEDEVYLRARLVVFRQEGNRWKVVAETRGLASNIPERMLPVAVYDVTDFDHDGVQEILVSFASLIPGYLDGVYHLYRWDGSTLRRVWITTSIYDNTTVGNQPDFATQVAWPLWKDTDGDGIDDLLLKVFRRAYERSSVGVANTSRVREETTSDVLYRWGGKGFMLVSP